MTSNNDDQHDSRGAWRFVVISFALVAAFWLLREHWGHALGLLPYLLLLACPLLHLFGHHSHGGHGHHGGDENPGRGSGEHEPEHPAHGKL